MTHDPHDTPTVTRSGFAWTDRAWRFLAISPDGERYAYAETAEQARADLTDPEPARCPHTSPMLTAGGRLVCVICREILP